MSDLIVMNAAKELLVTSETTLLHKKSWYFQSCFPTALKCLYLIPVFFFMTFWFRHGLDFKSSELWIALLIITVFLAATYVYLFSDEFVSINASTLEHSFCIFGVAYRKKQYLCNHIYNLRVYPKMSQESLFDPTGPFSNELRLHMLGGSVVFDYGPLYRGVQLFKGMPENKAKEHVEEMSVALNKHH
ncbi:hypothetical protein [Enterovibrio norvegicus]|uniref:hypothetical protein n=1 Tax=Enterovibrio norvegicus TaxID=188144 RepID=UPI000CB25979|nr:hypothetical protein [Enterovibrio norvegicus]PML80633.1 hypothetical protein BCT69_10465 [Enterovibrio norvegicus]